MKHTCSITDESGLTVSLEVSVPLSFFEHSGEALAELYADQGLASSVFAQVLPQLSTQLQQARSAIELALLDSYNKGLQTKLANMDKEEITNLLKEAGVSQTAIAETLKVSPAAVHYVVSGKKSTPRIRQALASAVGKSVTEIWPESAKEGKKKSPSPEHN